MISINVMLTLSTQQNMFYIILDVNYAHNVCSRYLVHCTELGARNVLCAGVFVLVSKNTREQSNWALFQICNSKSW